MASPFGVPVGASRLWAASEFDTLIVLSRQGDSRTADEVVAEHWGRLWRSRQLVRCVKHHVSELEFGEISYTKVTPDSVTAFSVTLELSP